jgi:hypothetical protein
MSTQLQCQWDVLERLLLAVTGSKNLEELLQRLRDRWAAHDRGEGR